MAQNLTIRQQVDIYISTLAFQYKSGTKNRPALSIYIKQLFGDLLARQVLQGFDIDTAVGPQLDILGKYVGVARNIGLPVDKPYYNFSDYDGTLRPNGFTDYLNPAMNAQALWYQYQFSGTENTALTDTAYRFILKLKIILNINDGTLASVMDLLETFFPGTVALTDNKDMTITYTLTRQAPVDPEVIKAFLPKPMGVGVNYEFFTVVAAPDTISLSVSSPTPHAFVGPTAASVITPTNGVAPYRYSWQFISETNPGDFGHTIADTPEAASTTFERAFNAYGVAESKWLCNVSDARGLVVQSNEVTVTLELTP